MKLVRLVAIPGTLLVVGATLAAANPATAASRLPFRASTHTAPARTTGSSHVHSTCVRGARESPTATAAGNTRAAIG